MYRWVIVIELCPAIRAKVNAYAKEIPCSHIVGANDPCYPIPRAENRLLCERHATEAKKMNRKIQFFGRLGEYRYYSMHHVVSRALDVFRTAAESWYSRTDILYPPNRNYEKRITWSAVNAGFTFLLTTEC